MLSHGGWHAQEEQSVCTMVAAAVTEAEGLILGRECVLFLSSLKFFAIRSMSLAYVVLILLLSAASRNSLFSSSVTGDRAGNCTFPPSLGLATNTKKALQMCWRCPVYGSSLSTTRPTSKLLLKDLLTTAFRTTTCPTLTELWNVMLSTDTVTQGICACRSAERQAATSIQRSS